MQLKIKNLYPFILLICFMRCENSKERHHIHYINHQGANLSAPYLTTDHMDRPVISWVEEKNNKRIFCYATYTNRKIDTIKKVPCTQGLSSSNESMPKIAFKYDGTIFIVFHKRIKNTYKFAGAIYYTMSTDQGLSWSNPECIHSDTSQKVGRHFFDVSTLPNGEIGAVWLDGRFKNEKGSSLYFAQTDRKKGFDTDRLLKKNTCQCCRTNLIVDDLGHIHIAFRDLIQDSIRDISYIWSTDTGRTFSHPKRVSIDNWTINGCPHTGPSMSMGHDSTLHIYWFSLGNGKGVYTTQKDRHNSFSPRKLVHKKAKYPQSASNNKTLALIWQENHINKKRSTSSIYLQNMQSTQKYMISNPQIQSVYPVIIGYNKSFLTAWTIYRDQHSTIALKQVGL